MQTLFSVPKIPLLIETYHPVKEKRRDEEVMCIRVRCKVQPFDAKLATSIDDGLDAGVRALLFKLNNPDPKPVVGVLKLNLDCPRQNIELFPTPDTDSSRLMLLQTKISGAYARDQRDVSGFAFCFDATQGPVDRSTLEYIHSLVGKQVWASFTESEPSLEFSSETPDEDDADDPPFANLPPPMFDDDDEHESEGVKAAKAATTDRKRETGHRYTRRHSDPSKAAKAKKAAKRSKGKK